MILKKWQSKLNTGIDYLISACLIYAYEICVIMIKVNLTDNIHVQCSDIEICQKCMVKTIKNVPSYFFKWEKLHFNILKNICFP